MATLLLQAVVVPLLTLVFGAVAWRVGRAAAAGDGRGAAWRLTAIPFLLLGAHGLVHNALAVRAFFAPRGSPAGELWLAVKAVGNDGRGVMMLGFAAMLLALLAARRPLAGVGTRRWTAALLGWMAGGSAVGLLEGPFTGAHYMVIAANTTATVICLLAVLWVALQRDAVDALLWSALALYAVREVVAVGITSLFPFVGAGAWVPSWRSLQEVSAGAYLLMLACAATRLRWARRGWRVPSLLEATAGGGLRQR
jgi:hypothetical protein